MIHVRRPLLLVVLVIAITPFVTACGNSASDEAKEQAAKAVLKENGGKSTDVDVNGDKVTFKSKEGDATFSTSDELPKGWPGDLDMPEGATIVGSSSTKARGHHLLTVSATTDDEPSAVLEHFTDELDGWKQEGNGSYGSGDSAVVTSSWSKGADRVTLTATSAKGNTSFSVVYQQGA